MHTHHLYSCFSLLSSLTLSFSLSYYPSESHGQSIYWLFSLVVGLLLSRIFKLEYLYLHILTTHKSVWDGTTGQCSRFPPPLPLQKNSVWIPAYTCSVMWTCSCRTACNWSVKYCWVCCRLIIINIIIIILLISIWARRNSLMKLMSTI